MPIGVGFVCRGLEVAGVDYDVINLQTKDFSEREDYFVRQIEDRKGNVFGFGIVIGNRNLEVTLKYANLVKEISEDNIVVFGGPLPSAIPKLVLQKTCCDYVVMGEGEERFPNLVKNLLKGEPLTVIEGVLSRNCKDVDDSNILLRLKKLKNLNIYSPPSYEQLNEEFYINYYKNRSYSCEIIGSRGCVANCTFCFKFIGTGYNCRTYKSVIEEINYFKNKYDINRFYFREENFFQNKDLFLGLMKEREKSEFYIRCGSRLDVITDKLLPYLCKEMILSIGFGIESINPDTLVKIKKRIKIDSYVGKIEALNKKGIEPKASFIIGFPDDKEEDYEKMYEFIIKNRLKGSINLLTVLPATQLYYQLCETMNLGDEWDYTKQIDQATLYGDLTINLTNLPNEIIIAHYKRLKGALSTAIESSITDEFSPFIKGYNDTPRVLTCNNIQNSF